MVLVDKGNGKGILFGHTDYHTGEGRGVTRSGNAKERYVNPEMTVKERRRISGLATNERNRYRVHLFGESNTQIFERVQYNPFTEALSLSWIVMGNHGKRLLRVSEPETEKRIQGKGK